MHRSTKEDCDESGHRLQPDLMAPPTRDAHTYPEVTPFRRRRIPRRSSLNTASGLADEQTAPPKRARTALRINMHQIIAGLGATVAHGKRGESKILRDAAGGGLRWHLRTRHNLSCFRPTPRTARSHFRGHQDLQLVDALDLAEAEREGPKSVFGTSTASDEGYWSSDDWDTSTQSMTTFLRAALGGTHPDGRTLVPALRPCHFQYLSPLISGSSYSDSNRCRRAPSRSPPISKVTRRR